MVECQNCGNTDLEKFKQCSNYVGEGFCYTCGECSSNLILKSPVLD